MNDCRDYAAVIPCFNEAAHISQVVKEVLSHVPHVIVVDDGSTDATAEVAAQAGAEVIRHSVNRGKGAALRTGWQRAREREFVWALLLDGDAQHAPADVPALIECSRQTEAAMVVGNRLHDPQAMPWLRRQVNRLMTGLLSRLTGHALEDSQCGFRLVHLETVCRLPLKADRFEIESELLVTFLRAGCIVKFVPVQVIYNNGPSKIRPLPDTVRWLRWWLPQLAALIGDRWRGGRKILLARTAPP